MEQKLSSVLHGVILAAAKTGVLVYIPVLRCLLGNKRPEDEPAEFLFSDRELFKAFTDLQAAGAIVIPKIESMSSLQCVTVTEFGEQLWKQLDKLQVFNAVYNFCTTPRSRYPPAVYLSTISLIPIGHLPTLLTHTECRVREEAEKVFDSKYKEDTNVE